MHQTIYQILRDTGRRPGEVVSLQIGCLEVIDGQHNLIYDNHKAGRLRRRLPITTDTAEIIAAWQRHRTQLPTAPATRQWLFPSPLLRARQSRGHLTASCVGVAFRAWTRSIPTIDGELLGPDGAPLPFDPSLITPYALRHSYAQRHADAGVPVDVLKELMDHRAVATTMGYYSVSLKRKQQAIRSVGSLAIDAAGNPAPFTDPLAYQRASVSVPFGNCTEPSNVKAGGGACPIRFQCAGCGFYRPDPSYLPALEQHIHSRRPGNRPGDRRRRLRDRQPDRRDRRVHPRRRHDAAPARRTRPRATRRGRGGQPDPAPRPRRPPPPADRHLGQGDRMSTTTANQDRTAALKAARAKDSHANADAPWPRSHALEATGAPITAAAVATAAGVSTWLVYADGIREHLDAARHRQSPPQRRRQRRRPPATTPATPASLRTDLAVAREEIRRYAPNATNSGSACACNSAPRSKHPTGPTSSPASPTSKPSTVNSSPNATPAPSRPTPPNAASPNSKTTSPPPEKACAASSKPKTAHHDAHLCSRLPHCSRTLPRASRAPHSKNASDQQFFRKKYR